MHGQYGSTPKGGGKCRGRAEMWSAGEVKVLTYPLKFKATALRDLARLSLSKFEGLKIQLYSEDK